MERVRSMYDVQLTYRDGLDFNPGEYKEKCNLFGTQDIEQYREIASRHLKALFESVRRHARTQSGYGWAGELRGIVSCTKGCAGASVLRTATQHNPHLFNLVNRDISAQLNRPERLHIHLLVDAIPGRTVTEWIAKYWSKRYGYAKKQRLLPEERSEWYDEYVESQRLCVVKGRFGGKG